MRGWFARWTILARSSGSACADCGCRGWHALVLRDFTRTHDALVQGASWSDRSVPPVRVGLLHSSDGPCSVGNHHLHQPGFIAEAGSREELKIVWQSHGIVKPSPWLSFGGGGSQQELSDGHANE